MFLLKEPCAAENKAKYFSAFQFNYQKIMSLRILKPSGNIFILCKTSYKM